MQNSQAAPVARIRTIMALLLRSTGHSHYRHQTAFCMTREELCLYDVHCVIATAMGVFFSMVPSVIDPTRLAMAHLPLEVRLAAMASLTVALKFENEVQDTPSTRAFYAVLYECERDRSRERAVRLIAHYETVVLQHASVFKCATDNHHRLALHHVVHLCDAGVIDAPRGLCAVRLATFIVLNTFFEASAMRLDYAPATVGAAVGAAAVACCVANSSGAKLVPRIGSREELVLARTLLVSIAASGTPFRLLDCDGSWLDNAMCGGNLRRAVNALMEVLCE